MTLQSTLFISKKKESCQEEIFILKGCRQQIWWNRDHCTWKTLKSLHVTGSDHVLKETERISVFQQRLWLAPQPFRCIQVTSYQIKVFNLLLFFVHWFFFPWQYDGYAEKWSGDEIERGRWTYLGVHPKPFIFQTRPSCVFFKYGTFLHWVRVYLKNEIITGCLIPLQSLLRWQMINGHRDTAAERSQPWLAR